MRTRRLGTNGPEVSTIGLGCMGMSGIYGPADEEESIATIHAALDAGVTLLDTGDYYGMGHNELLIGEALRGRDRDDVLISVKFGALRAPTGVARVRRPAGGGEDLPRVHAAAGWAPTTSTSTGRGGRPVRADRGDRRRDRRADRGRLRAAVGLSEAGAETVRRAQRCTRSPTSRSSTRCSRGGSRTRSCRLPRARRRDHRVRRPHARADERPLVGGPRGRTGDFRRAPAAFSAENVDRNLALVEALRAIADAKDATVAQVAIAWVLSRGEDIVPLVGARRRDRLAEALGALDLELDRRGPGRDRGGRPCGLGLGRPIRRGADGVARQRTELGFDGLRAADRHALAATAFVQVDAAAGEGLLLLVEPDRKQPVEVVAGVDLERDQRLGPGHAVDACDALRDHAGELLVRRYADDRPRGRIRRRPSTPRTRRRCRRWPGRPRGSRRSRTAPARRR